MFGTIMLIIVVLPFAIFLLVDLALIICFIRSLWASRHPKLHY